MIPDPSLLLQLVEMKMPFGKYEGHIICNLPISYLEWFNRNGFPKGKLGGSSLNHVRDQIKWP